MASEMNLTAEQMRARREMLNHLSQRSYGLPRKAMKLFKSSYCESTQGYARKVWRDLLRAEYQPRRELYMPGRR